MKSIVLILSLVAQVTFAQSPMIKGMNLSEERARNAEDKGHYYDASLDGAKTEAQLAVDQIKKLGANHVVLNPKAVMYGPNENELIPFREAMIIDPTTKKEVPLDAPESLSEERGRYKRLIDYIHSQGMTVGIRPIFFVINKVGGTMPYIDAQGKQWWHGNIQPKDVNIWFDFFKQYLARYMIIGKITNIEEFTIGAELYSLTVGIEDQWKANPYGFPAQWNDVLALARSKLPKTTRVMYDINFTDDKVSSVGLGNSGGELERWRYRLVDLASPKDPNQAIIWKELVKFWLGLDAVGIDMYRSLASPNDQVPADYQGLVSVLKRRTDQYASQLDNTMLEIQMKLDETEKGVPTHKKIIFKEVGYRSADRGFIDPFAYDDKSKKLQVNIPHQAAAYEAFFKTFFVTRWDWMGGASFWDASVDQTRKGAADAGFTPIDKAQTETVIKGYFGGAR